MISCLSSQVKEKFKQDDGNMKEVYTSEKGKDIE